MGKAAAILVKKGSPSRRKMNGSSSRAGSNRQAVYRSRKHRGKQHSRIQRNHSRKKIRTRIGSRRYGRELNNDQVYQTTYQDGFNQGYAKGYEDGHQLTYANQV